MSSDPREDVYICQIRDLVYGFAGIYQPENRLRFLEDRCARRMQKLGLASLREYFLHLRNSPGRGAELNELLNEVTIGETCFFRNQPQLDAFQRLVLPMVLANKKHLPMKRIRIWSAGCSTGEEPFTLAMLLLEEKAGLLRDCSFEILATDLNQRSLAEAQAGIYGEYATRNLSPYFRVKHFVQEANGKLRVQNSLRSLVRFSRLNLLDDGGMTFMKGIDVIFCCNVLIYFDSASKRRVIQHFYNNLLPNSYLFLGHSESLFGINSDFQLVHFPGSGAYLKSSAPRREL
jgi:chemotaxis protein methyltransferase CheR